MDFRPSTETVGTILDVSGVTMYALLAIFAFVNTTDPQVWLLAEAQATQEGLGSAPRKHVAPQKTVLGSPARRLSIIHQDNRRIL